MESTTRSPVLFLIFNRLDTAERVFAEIRKAQPARLYIAADGPRPDKPGELEKCLQARALLQKVDWNCEVKTLFRETNLGCRNAVSEAVTWFFEHETEGIILEDDCLPHQDFFPFCTEMLARYRDDVGVFAISGSNIIGTRSQEADYFFSLVGGIWGWASWRRAWAHYRLNIQPEFTSSNWRKIRHNLRNVPLARTLETILRAELIEREPNTWDYQWLFMRMLLNGKSVIPNSNLVSNLGFSTESTHTQESDNPLANLPMMALRAPFRQPADETALAAFDAAYLRHFRKPLLCRLHTKLRKWFHV